MQKQMLDESEILSSKDSFLACWVSHVFGQIQQKFSREKEKTLNGPLGLSLDVGLWNKSD